MTVATQAIAPVSDSAALMTAVARAASDPTVDVEKMERLFAMHERMEGKQSERAYAEAMTRVQMAMPTIEKTRKNAQTNSEYADLEAINKAIVPVYTAEGFSLSFGQADCPTADCVRITCDVLHAGGHSKNYWYDNPIDDAGIAGKTNKTPTHGRSSATTYARRYITNMIFNLTIGDDDDGNGVHNSLARSVDPSWFDGVAAAVDQTGLKALKAEMMTAYGSPTGIPKELIRAWNEKWSAVSK